MPDGRLMPGCSYNNLYRHKDERFFPHAEPVSPMPVEIRPIGACPDHRREETIGISEIIDELRELIVRAAPDPVIAAPVQECNEEMICSTTSFHFRRSSCWEWSSWWKIISA